MTNIFNDIEYCFQSSLLLAILDQMPTVEGYISSKGTIAFVPQEAWVFSATIRDNILFGLSLQPSKYDEAIRSCALTQVRLYVSGTYCTCIWNIVMDESPGYFG